MCHDSYSMPYFSRCGATGDGSSARATGSLFHHLRTVSSEATAESLFQHLVNFSHTHHVLLCKRCTDGAIDGVNVLVLQCLNSVAGGTLLGVMPGRICRRQIVLLPSL